MKCNLALRGVSMDRRSCWLKSTRHLRKPPSPAKNLYVEAEDDPTGSPRAFSIEIIMFPSSSLYPSINLSELYHCSID